MSHLCSVTSGDNFLTRDIKQKPYDSEHMIKRLSSDISEKKMNLNFDPTLVPLIITTLVLIQIPSYFCQNDQDQYETCTQPFHCGELTQVGYPFYGGDRPIYCGYPGFEMNCQGVPRITIESNSYRVLSVDNSAQTLTVSRDDLWDDICPMYLVPTTLNFTLFEFSSSDFNITLYYGCDRVVPSNQFNCSVNGTNTWSFYGTTNTGLENGLSCANTITVPVNETAFLALTSPTALSLVLLQDALRSGFSVQWSAQNEDCVNCVRSRGVCGYNQDRDSFACHCNDGTHELNCNDSRNGNGSQSRLGLIIGLAVAGAVLAGTGFGLFILYLRRRRKLRVSTQPVIKDIPSTHSNKAFFSTPSTIFTKTTQSYPSSNSSLSRGSTYFGVQVFSFAELQEATDNFNDSRELGDGGFGRVYYGVLSDGRVVAIKLLYENNFKRMEQFMNEIEILTRLRHENLVTLYGCTSRTSRELLLVYEYIPNGTVADHLHGDRTKSRSLSWPSRLNIAIETAEALAYLHKSDVIHRDVKTNNILLDNEFHVKVADFGLSRLFPTDVTHVSTAPQGTPGYVDPEYYQYYKLTEKSDVYSFGVVLIELISSLPAVDVNRQRNDINLANMAVNKIQNHALHELVDPILGFETNGAVRKTGTLIAEVAFRCLQQERDMRPSMEEVVEALKDINNDDLNAHKVDIIDISMDDDDDQVPLNGSADIPSPPNYVYPRD